MIDRSFGRGLALIAIALAFGLEALRYPIDRLSQSRPGLFPLMVSGLLLLIGVSVVVRSRFVERVPIDFNAKNIGIVLVSLRAFALVSTLVNMTLGIAALVFIASFAGKSYSLTRNRFRVACRDPPVEVSSRQPTSSRRARSVTMVLCAREDAHPSLSARDRLAARRQQSAVWRFQPILPKAATPSRWHRNALPRVCKEPVLRKYFIPLGLAVATGSRPIAVAR